MAHILVVDQDDILAELAAGMLACAGHVCSFAFDAAEAWRMLQWRRPDVLLLDEAMPDASGSPFRHRLRESPAYFDLPVLVLTAADTGAPDAIRKPLQHQALHEHVARLLEARPAQWAEFQLHHRKDDAPRRVYL